jgi:hypothetical protein
LICGMPVVLARHVKVLIRSRRGLRAVFDGNVLPLNPAQLAQPLLECCILVCRFGAHRKIADVRQLLSLLHLRGLRYHEEVGGAALHGSVLQNAQQDHTPKVFGREYRAGVWARQRGLYAIGCQGGSSATIGEGKEKAATGGRRRIACRIHIASSARPALLWFLPMAAFV